jgi:hypothetical protein
MYRVFDVKTGFSLNRLKIANAYHVQPCILYRFRVTLQIFPQRTDTACG